MTPEINALVPASTPYVLWWMRGANLQLFARAVVNQMRSNFSNIVTGTINNSNGTKDQVIYHVFHPNHRPAPTTRAVYGRLRLTSDAVATSTCAISGDFNHNYVTVQDSSFVPVAARRELPEG